MNIDDMFPSQWLKGTELQGRDALATISHVAVEEVGDDGERPVVYFVGKTKGLVLNRTNADTLSKILGSQTDQWSGAKCTLFTVPVKYNGQMYDAIRVKNVIPPQAQELPPKSKGGEDDLNDEIPW